MSSPDIYDMLTQMLQLFRCKLETMRQINHRMAYQYFQEKDFNDTRVQLAQMFHQQLKMMPQLNDMATYNNNINTILYRFFSRIIEIVQGEKSKSRTTAYNSHYDYLSQMEGLIYQAVSTKQTDHIETLFSLYEKSHKYAAGTLLSCLDQKMRSLKPKEPIPLLKIQTPLRIYSTSLQVPSPLKPQSSLDQSPTKKSNPPKVMQALKVLDCLDMDQSTFRSVYLYCKHHSQVVDDETMERNIDIVKEINAYKKAYSDYQTRKARRTLYVKTRKDSTGMDVETEGPLQSLPQSITPSRRAQKNKNQKQYSSLRRLNPEQRAPSKQNSTGMLDIPQYKYTWDECKSPKRGLSPKKVLISFRKLALKPVDMEARATLSNTQSKKKNKMRLSNRKLRESFDMLIEGQKIKDRDLRRTQYRLFHDKNLTSNLFST